jgi:glycosidase
MIFSEEDSVVQRYLRQAGIDGWRLDVAPDLGFHWLAELTRSAHNANPESVLIGECWNYPEEWLNVLDGVMNMHARLIILALVEGRISAPHAGRLLDRMVQDAGIDGLLKSHLVIDNHDIARIATLVPDLASRQIAHVLQFTLPGCPVIYYGSELGMAGGYDPENRAPMRWDLVTDDNPTLTLHRNLLQIRRENPALRVGEFRLLDTEQMLAFIRLTARARETVLVAINPTDQTSTELMPLRDSRLMDASPLICQLTGEQAMASCGLLELTLPPRSARIFRTKDRGAHTGYSAFKRVP